MVHMGRTAQAKQDRLALRPAQGLFNV